MVLNQISKINKRQWISFIAILVLIFINFTPLYAKTEKHFLWSIETDKGTIYFLGSIHILKPESYPLPEAVEKIYECCKTLVFETDLDGMNDPESQTRMMKLGLYPAGQKLSQNISRHTYTLLKKRLSASGLSITQFEQFKPWFAAMTLTALELQRLGFYPDLGIDRYFFNRAKRDNKNMVFLETNEFQLNLMANLSKRQQELFLGEVLEELEIIETMASDMLSAWRTGNVNAMYSIIKMSFDEYPEIYNRFFVHRNKRWIHKIERLIKQNGDVLVIVGAGHLVGKDNIIDLLRKKGYKVKQR
jgi:hypothetical protein